MLTQRSNHKLANHHLYFHPYSYSTHNSQVGLNSRDYGVEGNKKGKCVDTCEIRSRPRRDGITLSEWCVMALDRMDRNPGLQEHQLAVIEAVRSSDCIVRCIFTGTSSCFIEQTVNSDSRLLLNHQCRIRIPSEFCILLQAEQFAHCKTPTYLASFSSKGTKFYQCTGLLSQVQEKRS